MKDNKRLQLEFYTRKNTLEIARELLGKELVSFVDQRISSGIITETEAYMGVVDKASHAFGDRKTRRTNTMYMQGGIAYIYLCYGIHSLFNVVTNIKDVPHAVLIRAIYPLKGRSVMSERLGRITTHKEGIGPGKVTKLLGLTYANDTESLLVDGNKIWIEDAGLHILESNVRVTSRIGVNYAGEDAFLPYRFVIDHSCLHEDIKKAFLE